MRPAFSDSDLAAIRAELDALLSAPGFAGSPRRARLLRYLADRTLDGSEISEYGIGLDVFGKTPSFDPRIDSTIRSEISRLRAKLKEHYAVEGLKGGVSIELPPRGYAVEFKIQQQAAEPRRASPWRWVPIAVTAGIILAAAGFGAWKAARKPIDSLVVLPFQNLSPDPGNEYLADGFTEELTNDLAQWPDLRVVARTSAYQFKGKGVDVREVGRRLNVAAALEGSVEKSGDRVRVTAQMNRTSDGYHIWSKSFEGRSADVMVLKEQLARSIADMVRGGGQAAARPAARSTTNPEAMELYLRGNYEYSRHTPEAYTQALNLCRASAAKDPGYLLAYLCLARVQNSLIHLTLTAPDAGLAELRKALDEALKIDPDCAEAHGFLGNIAYIYDWDWPRADREYRFALEHGNPPRVHIQYGWALATRGRFREAQDQFRLGNEADPMNPSGRFNEMLAYYLERRYGDANRVLRTMIEVNPEQLDAHSFVALIAALNRDCATAVSESEWCARKAQIPFTTFLLALGSACRGDQAQAREYLQKMASMATGFESPYQLAMGYAALHEPARAISYLEKSAAAHEGQIMYLKYDPIFDGIRAEPGFVALETRVGLL